MVADGLSQEEIDALSGGGGGGNNIDPDSKRKIDTFVSEIESNLVDVFKTLMGADEVNVIPQAPVKNTLLTMSQNIGENALVFHITKGGGTGEAAILFKLQDAATVADLMVMGTGQVDFNEAEHPEAMGELLNQVFGLLSTAISGHTGASVSFGQAMHSLEDTTDIDIFNFEFAVNMAVSAKAMFDINMLFLFSKAFLTEVFAAPAPANSGKNSATTSVAEEAMPVGRPAEFSQLHESRSAEPPKNIDLIMDITLELSVELGRTKMQVREILDLGPGAVINLKKLAGEPVEVLVNNKLVAKGEVVVLDENFGVRITSLVSREDRIKSLGKGE